MIRRTLILLLCVAALPGLGGCASILDDDTLSVTAHEEQVTAEPADVIEAGSYDELKDKILDFIGDREDSGLIYVYSYSGDLEADVGRVCGEIMTSDPIGAYAVTGLDGSVRQIVSYHEVEVKISYKNVTKEQLDSIIPVSTLRYLKSDLKNKLIEYAPSMTVLLKNVSLTADEALGYVSELYYENPMDIVMLPVTTVEFYPENGPERIAEFVFGYRYEDSTLGAMEKSLNHTVSGIAESVTGNSDGAILLSLARRLAEIAEYDKDTAAGGEYSNQNTSATAYGALVTGSAIGEGYAMAYKALCDELGYECRVVLGTHNGTPHAWNIVELGGFYYHIDVAMCDVNGMSAAFLKKDADMARKYAWDTEKYEVCDGPLTYAAITGGG